MRKYWLACLLLVGCTAMPGANSAAGYERQAEGCVKAAQAWVGSPKDKGLVMKAFKKCESTVKDYSGSDAAGRKSYANLQQLKASLETVKNTLADGGDPNASDSMSNVSQVESVKIVITMVESELANERRRSTQTPAT